MTGSPARSRRTRCRWCPSSPSTTRSASERRRRRRRARRPASRAAANAFGHRSPKVERSLREEPALVGGLRLPRRAARRTALSSSRSSSDSSRGHLDVDLHEQVAAARGPAATGTPRVLEAEDVSGLGAGRDVTCSGLVERVDLSTVPSAACVDRDAAQVDEVEAVALEATDAGATRTVTYRSPAMPLRGAAGPRPVRRSRCPSSMPAGTSTSMSRVERTRPSPPQLRARARDLLTGAGARRRTAPR